MQPKRLSRKESQEQTRERLMQAAATVFSRRGYHAASVDEIAAEAGYSKGAVYSNFAGKEELLLALIDQRFERDLQAFGSIGAYAAAAPGMEQASGYPAAVTADRTWILLLIEFFLYAMRDEAVREKMAARLAGLRQRMADSLRDQYAGGGQRPALPIEFLPWAIVTLGIGVTVQYYLNEEALPEHLYERLLAQLFAPPPTAP
jgi:AcrR family transcriptional regulator